MTHDQLQTVVIDALHLLGHYPMHIPMGGKSAAVRLRMARQGAIAGTPDLIVASHDGRLGLIEIKPPGKYLNQAQQHVHAELNRRNTPVAVVQSIEELCAVLTSWGWSSSRGADWRQLLISMNSQ